MTDTTTQTVTETDYPETSVTLANHVWQEVVAALRDSTQTSCGREVARHDDERHTRLLSERPTREGRPHES